MVFLFYMLLNKVVLKFEELGKFRLDKFLVIKFPDRTRQYFQKIIKGGSVKINGKLAKASNILSVGDRLEIVFPKPKDLELKAKNIPLDVVYEDENILVINKPAGMVVHPGSGDSHLDDSLVNAVLFYCKDSLSGIGGVLRPGIVHRLDKDTSGLLIVAKNDFAHQFLAKQFKDHQVKKTYYALLLGKLEPRKGIINSPIGRNFVDRKKMAVRKGKDAREAVTEYEVIDYLGDCTFVKINLITGRTHQIRVHFSSIGFPLVGDPIYGRIKVNKYYDREYAAKRLFLHAGEISFLLPAKVGSKNPPKKVEFKVALPDDLQQVINALTTL